MIKDEYHERFADKIFAPFIRSEICALDMLYAVTSIEDGYYKERLSLKGGLSVRSIVPLEDHRFSFDADFDPNTFGGFSYRNVCGLKEDLMKYGSARGCRTSVQITKDDSRLCFIEIGYRGSLGSHTIVERPKVEVCKTCRILERPVLEEINTIIDLEMLGLKPPKVNHLSLEEQFAMKLFVIGADGRQRNHFDAYDAFGIFKHGPPNMRKARCFFKKMCRRKPNIQDYVEECRRQLDTMLKNDKKRTRLEQISFVGDVDFDTMIEKVKSFYNFGDSPPLAELDS